MRPRQQRSHSGPSCETWVYLAGGPWVPVSAGRRPHPLTPSSWRGRGEAGPPWGKLSGRRGSTGRSQCASGPTTLQQLPGEGAVTGPGPQQVTWPLRPGSAQRRDPPPTRKKGSSGSECPPPRLGDRREQGEGQEARTGVSSQSPQDRPSARCEVRWGEDKRVWRQDSLSLVL